MIASLDVIAESSLAPVWEKLLDEFPFIILEFHSDNESENINRYTAAILNSLNIKQLKGRPRHTNDNAQVETKNGVVIRKCMGYLHIPKMYAGTKSGIPPIWVPATWIFAGRNSKTICGAFIVIPHLTLWNQPYSIYKKFYLLVYLALK